MAQVVQDLPRKYKALSSKPSTVKTKTNKQKGQKDLDRHFIKDFQMANDRAQYYLPSEKI
jgi:hypothetical protein